MILCQLKLFERDSHNHCLMLSLIKFHQLSQLHPENELYTLNKVQALMQVGDTTAALTSANNYLNTYPDANRVKDFAEGL